MLGTGKTIGGDLNPQDAQKFNQHMREQMRVTDDKLVVCECGCELFLSPIRMAKMKVDLVNEAIGMVQERLPTLFCFNCKKEVPKDISLIKSKGELDGIRCQ